MDRGDKTGQFNKSVLMRHVIYRTSATYSVGHIIVLQPVLFPSKKIPMSDVGAHNTHTRARIMYDRRRLYNCIHGGIIYKPVEPKTISTMDLLNFVAGHAVRSKGNRI